MLVHPKNSLYLLRPDMLQPLAAAGADVADIAWCQQLLAQGYLLPGLLSASTVPGGTGGGTVSGGSGGSTVSGGATAATCPVAGTLVPGHRVLMTDGLGGVVPANPGAAGYQFAGISGGAAAVGTPVQVIETGPMTEPTWTWSPGLPLFVAARGTLTQTAPVTGVLQQVAVAVTATTILIQAYPPILLAP